MRSRLATHLLTCALTAPALIAGGYTFGLAVVVTDVHLFENELLERAPAKVRALADAVYGDFVPVYRAPFTYCDFF